MQHVGSSAPVRDGTRSPALGAHVLSHGPPGKSLNNFKLGTSVCTLPFRKGANTCTRKTLLTNSDLKGLPQEYSKALLVLRETKEVSP